MESGEGGSSYGAIFDGLHLVMPDESSKEQHVPDASKDVNSEETLMSMLEALKKNGYCLMQTSQRQDMQELMMSEADTTLEFVRPYVEFEVAYLGNESNSKVHWFNEDVRSMQASGVGNDKSAHPHYIQHLDAVQDLLASMTGMAFGFLSEPTSGPKLLRRSCTSPSEHQRLEQALPSEEDLSDGAEARFLDFVQRRRLCMMYMINCSSGSFVEFQSRDEDYFTWKSSQKIPLATGQLLIFQHDVLAYSYQSVDPDDLVLQSWLLEEARSLHVEKLSGDNEAIFSTLGAVGSVVPHKREVHIRSLDYRLSGNIENYSNLIPAIAAGVDGPIMIPTSRWDHTLYFHPEGEQGKAWSKHSAFMEDWYMFGFDHSFFGIKYEDAANLLPPQRVQLEMSYATLSKAGFTKKTARNQHINIIVSSLEKDLFPWKLQHNLGSEISDHHQASTLVAHTYGLRGSLMHVDTACSSTNVTNNLAYQQLRIERDATSHYRLNYETNVIGALVSGDSFFDGPAGFVGLSQAHMVGRSGRARTFDMSADGMQRGENSAMIFQCVMDDTFVENLVSVLGGAINQDGRSASLTAPNGPSQSKVIRSAEQDSGRGVDDTTVTELHGTGTALGDPIETGSCRAVMMSRSRDALPLLHSAGKSNSNHNELSAGCSGITRQIMAIQTSISPPNMHIRVLNSNIDLEGYPAFWPTERVHLGKEYMHNGISSFGFGGTNARFEIWGRCRFGVNKTVHAETTDSGTLAFTDTLDMKKMPDWGAVNMFVTTCRQCMGSMCWTCGEAYEEDAFGSSPKHVCRSVRSETADYQLCSLCYKGDYLVDRRKTDNVGDPGRRVYIVKNAWSLPAYEEMQQMIDGTYVHTINIGETGSINFNIVLDNDPNLTLYPVVANAPQQARVLGPDSNVKGRSWLIDAGKSNILAGSTYQISFRWDSDGKYLSWEALTTSPQQKEEQVSAYSIVGSWTSWKPEYMMQSATDANVWESTFQIGEQGNEEFQFICSSDFSQAIYPNGQKVGDTSVEILGPNDGGHGKNWRVAGKEGDLARVELKVDEGHITMYAMIENQSTMKWRSPVPDMSKCRRFFIAGSWNNWSFREQMQPTAVDLYVWQLVLESTGAEFQIVVDEDWSRTLHPIKARTLQIGEQCRAHGPDGKGHGVNWTITGSQGTTVEICLDLGQDDGIPILSCNPLGSSNL